MVQWLRLCASIAGVTRSILRWGSSMCHTVQLKVKKKRNIKWKGTELWSAQIVHSWGSQSKNAEMVCHSLLQWNTFCQNSPLWLVHLGWPYTARLIVSLSYTKPDMEQWTGSKLGKEYVKTVYCHPAYLTYMHFMLCEMLGWMKLKLESRWQREISITSDMQMTPPLW